MVYHNAKTFHFQVWRLQLAAHARDSSQAALSEDVHTTRYYPSTRQEGN
jgi:hypothetical protein